MKTPAFIQRLFAPKVKVESKANRHTRRTVSLCQALLSERGEASGAALAREAARCAEAIIVEGIDTALQRWP